MLSKLFRPSILIVAAEALLMIYILMIHPLIGMANSGDFLRIMQSAGINYADPSLSGSDKYFSYFIGKYALEAPTAGQYISTEILIVDAAVLLSKALTWSHLFDIRFLAALYGIAMLTASYLLVLTAERSSRLTGWAAALLVLIVFGDVGYLAYFNSFFGEPLTLTSLLLLLALAIRLTRTERPSGLLLALFFAAAALFAGAKVQNAPSGVLAALLGLRFMKLRPDRSWKRGAAAGSVLLLALSAAVYLMDSKEIKQINQYQALFYGVLKDSPHPEQDLREFGIKPEFAVLQNTNFFTPNTAIRQTDPILQTEVYPKASHLDIALFYARHPGRFLDKMKASAAQAFSLRPTYLGNYEKTENKPPRAISYTFSAWSRFKEASLTHSAGFLTGFAVATFAVLLFLRQSRGRTDEKVETDIFIMIGLIGLLNFAVPVIGSGEADLGKHLFLFQVSFDILASVGLLGIVHAAQKPF